MIGKHWKECEAQKLVSETDLTYAKKQMLLPTKGLKLLMSLKDEKVPTADDLKGEVENHEKVLDERTSNL